MKKSIILDLFGFLGLSAYFFSCASPAPKGSITEPVPIGGSIQISDPCEKSNIQWKGLDGVARTPGEVRNSLLKATREQGVSGVSVGLRQGSNWSLESEAYYIDLGYSDPECKNPIDSTTVFRADSLGESIIAYIVMQLVSQEMLDLDRPLFRYISSPSQTWPALSDIMKDRRLRRITARHVLSRRSGLTLSERANGPYKLAFREPPSRAFNLADKGYIFLTYVLEQKFNTNIGDLAKQLVFTPFGMSQSSFFREPRFRGHIAPVASDVTDSPEFPRAFEGEFFTNSRDFLKFTWNARLENPYLAHMAFMEYMILPSVSMRPTQIRRSEGQGKILTPPKRLRWCMGWGTFYMSGVIHDICSFTGGYYPGIESYAMVYESRRATALIIFVVSSSKTPFVPAVIGELLGEFNSPLLIFQ